MKKFFVLMCLAMGLMVTACNSTSVTCSLESVAATALTPVIASGLQCSNSAAIQATLISLGNQAGLCTAPQPGQQASIGSTVCVAVSGLILDQVAAQGIPASWGCTAANAKDLLKGLVNQACAKIP